MKNYVQPGDTVVVAAPANVLSGAGVLVGSLFGVASGDALSGADVALNTTGIYDMTKQTAQAWTVGQLLYWSGTNVTSVVSTNKLIGCAVRAELSGATVGRVRLNGVTITP